jgi:hypothetical protein
MEKVKIFEESNYPNRERGYSLDEQKFAKFSKDIFRISIFGYLIGIYLNIVFFNCWKNNSGILSMLITLFINYLFIRITMLKLLGAKENK